MTIREMELGIEALGRKYPGIYISFEIEVNKYSGRSVAETEISIYAADVGRFEGRSFDDCVRRLEEALAGSPAPDTSQRIDF